MDRLTVKNMYGFGVLRNPTICLRCGEADYGPTTEAGERVAERLQAYEDAAPLEEVRELVKAKREGRLEIITQRQKEARDYLLDYGAEDRYFDEEYR